MRCSQRSKATLHAASCPPFAKRKNAKSGALTSLAVPTKSGAGASAGCLGYRRGGSRVRRKKQRVPGSIRPSVGMTRISERPHSNVGRSVLRGPKKSRALRRAMLVIPFPSFRRASLWRDNRFDFAQGSPRGLSLHGSVSWRGFSGPLPPSSVDRRPYFSVWRLVRAWGWRSPRRLGRWHRLRQLRGHWA